MPFSSCEKFNGLIDGTVTPIPSKGFTKIGFLTGPFTKLTDRLTAFLKPDPAALEELNKPAKPAIEIEPYSDEKVDFDTFCKSDFRAVKVKACTNVKKSDKLLCFTLDDGTGTDRQILSGIAKFYKPEELVGRTLVAITNLPPRKMMGKESNGMLLSAVHTEKGEEKLNLVMLDDAIPAGAKLC